LRRRKSRNLTRTSTSNSAPSFVQKGTLKQLVRAILDYRMDISVAFERSDIVSEDAVKVAIGLQGQIRGIDNILALIHELMTQTKPEEEEDA
jgi:hypothetical protein